MALPNGRKIGYHGEASHIPVCLFYYGVWVCHFCCKSIKPLQDLGKASCINTGEPQQWKAGLNDSFWDRMIPNILWSEMSGTFCITLVAPSFLCLGGSYETHPCLCVTPTSICQTKMQPVILISIILPGYYLFACKKLRF